MGNFLGEIGKRVGDLVSHPVKISKDLVTDPSKGWDELTDLYTHNEHKDQDLFQKGFGIKGWVGDHPQETAAAVVASIFGGWAAAGAYGGASAGGAAGTAGGAAAGTAGGTISSGAGVGFGSATTGATGWGAGSVGATPFATGSATLSYAPSSATLLGGTGGSLTAGGTIGAGSTGATAGTGFGANSVGAMPFSEGSSVLSYTPSQATFSEMPGTSNSGLDTQQILQQVMRSNQNQQQQQSQPQITLHTKSGSFNYQPPSSTAYSQAQQLLNQALGTNQFSTNPFRR